jgi:hypothetical protein
VGAGDPRDVLPRVQRSPARIGSARSSKRTSDFAEPGTTAGAVSLRSCYMRCYLMSHQVMSQGSWEAARRSGDRSRLLSPLCRSPLPPWRGGEGAARRPAESQRRGHAPPTAAGTAEPREVSWRNGRNSADPAKGSRGSPALRRAPHPLRTAAQTDTRWDRRGWSLDTPRTPAQNRASKPEPEPGDRSPGPGTSRTAADGPRPSGPSGDPH